MPPLPNLPFSVVQPQEKKSAVRPVSVEMKMVEQLEQFHKQAEDKSPSPGSDPSRYCSLYLEQFHKQAEDKSPSPGSDPSRYYGIVSVC